MNITKVSETPAINGRSMNHLIQCKDWSDTPLGTPGQWPETLNTYARMMVVSPQPMIILWGSDHAALFNDACFEAVANCSTGTLGNLAGNIWPECWSELEPKVDSVLRHKKGDGDGIQITDYHKTKHYTFSLAPIIDNDGTAVGVLCIGNQNLHRLKRADEHFDRQIKNLFLHAPIAMCILRSDNFTVETVNSNMLKLWGKPMADVLRKPLFLAVPEAVDQGFDALLRQVYDRGEPYIAHEMGLSVSRGGQRKQIFVKLVFEPIRENDDSISGVMVIADEITENVEARKRIEISDTRQKLAIELAALGSFELDIESQEFIYSDRLAQIFGFKNNIGVKHEDLIRLIHHDDLHIRDRAIEQALHNGILFCEVRIIWDDNSLHWIRLNGRVLFNNQHQPNKIVGTVLDITDHKVQSYVLEKKVEERTRTLQQMNAELQRSEERYHRMTEEVQDYAILLLDTAGNILNWNKGAESIKGYSEIEAVGRHISMFYLPKDQEAKLPQTLINEAMVNGRSLNEGYRVRKDGSVFWASVAITALHDNHDNIIGFSKVTRDLTERKLAEDKMRQYNTELEFQNKELEQFAYVTSHDLQEPLRKIQMFTDLMYNNINNPDAVNKYFSKINNSATRMVSLIKSVLHYSKLSRSDSEFVETDLDSILNDVLTDFELMIDEKKATITKDRLPTINAIPLQINQLFSNLIGNALKFTDHKPEIKIAFDRVVRNEIKFPNNLADGNYIQICITDNGIGFDQKYVSQIFTVFQRLNERSSYGGTGIGLALCKKIADNHHGMITAESSPGKGSTFFIYLPVQPSA